MRTWLPICGFLLGASGCGATDARPAWGFDPIYLEPTESGVHGVVSWELFSERWERSYKQRYYLCGVLVEFEGRADDTCDGCYLTWSVTSELGDSDCPASLLENVTLPMISGIGLGEVGADLTKGNPHPGQSRGGYIAYDSGAFLPHGWAYPVELEATGAVSGAEWDGEQAFTLWPAWSVEVGHGASGDD